MLSFVPGVGLDGGRDLVVGLVGRARGAGARMPVRDKG